MFSILIFGKSPKIAGIIARRVFPEINVRFTKDQAFSPSYDLAPPPTPPPNSPVSKLDRQPRKTEKERKLLRERKDGVGEEPNHTAVRKPGPL